MSDPGAPTPERLARSAFVTAPAIGTEEGPAQAGARMYRSLSAVDRLLRDGSIEPAWAVAADRYRDDYELGVEGARDAPGSGSGTPGWYYADARLAALRRHELAKQALGALWFWTHPIACDIMSISMLASFLERNRQEISGIVKLGLETLAKHYGER